MQRDHLKRRHESDNSLSHPSDLLRSTNRLSSSNNRGKVDDFATFAPTYNQEQSRFLSETYEAYPSTSSKDTSFSREGFEMRWLEKRAEGVS